ncbi:MAG: prepilin-type N-terminal cleavage/methylation domain-containing protein [Patescibacteria group bacterium]
MNNKGVSLIEVVVVLGLLAVLVSALVELNLAFSRYVSAEGLSVRATAIAVETLEAVRALRDKNWNNVNNLTPGVRYYLSFSEASKDWTIETSELAKIDGAFTRSFSVYTVSRDISTGKIVTSGGVADNDTLKIEAIVSWDDHGRDKNIKLTTYLANF